MIRPLASYRALPLLPTAIVTGVIVTCALVTLAFQNEIAHEKNVFISQSHLIHEGVARRVTATEEVARSLALLFNASTVWVCLGMWILAWNLVLEAGDWELRQRLPACRDYMKRTPRYLPRVWKGRLRGASTSP